MYVGMLTERMASNLARAQQANDVGNDRDELRSLLFTVQDVTTLLVMWHRGKISKESAAKYVEILAEASLRIKELAVQHG